MVFWIVWLAFLDCVPFVSQQTETLAHPAHRVILRVVLAVALGIGSQAAIIITTSNSTHLRLTQNINRTHHWAASIAELEARMLDWRCSRWAS